MLKMNRLSEGIRFVLIATNIKIFQIPYVKYYISTSKKSLLLTPYSFVNRFSKNIKEAC